MERDTIAAISTPIGIGAVGIVRISGKTAKETLSRVWISSQHPVDNFITHRFYYGKISTGNNPPQLPFSKGGRGGIIDNVLAVWMAAPHSYTGEDVVEIHCHGGNASTKAVLKAVLNAGARASDPGEFTRRAFLNGKMDLAQAEGVADVINAASERSLKLANEQLEGRLSKVVKEILEELKGIKAFVEASIDFPDEDVEFIEHEEIGKKVQKVKDHLGKLSLTYNEGRLIHDGVKVVIVGKPNVGKSSILNALLGNERAIVHHAPGTTRDVIEEAMELDGVIYKLIDTAGLRDAECEVEKMGIARARMKLSEADIAIVVLDSARPFDNEDKKVLEETANLKRIVVLNKIDVETNPPSSPFTKGGLGGIIKASAKSGKGIEAIKKALKEFISIGSSHESEGTIITNLRHKRAIDDGAGFLLKVLASISKKESAEFTAYYLQGTMDSLGSITGEVTTEDVLNEIFSKFCIGK